MKKIIFADFREDYDGESLRWLKGTGYDCTAAEEKEITGLIRDRQALLVVIPVRNREKARNILRQVQEADERTPVIVTGRLESPSERIYWLEQGAFDCIPRNCSYKELEARIQVALRCH